MDPRGFEIFVKNLLAHCGFSDVCVTRFTADGGVDVNARAGGRIWIFENTLVQVQAKRLRSGYFVGAEGGRRAAR